MRASFSSPRSVSKMTLRCCVVVAALLCLASAADACPTCKAGLGAHDPAHGDLVTAYMWSILFMMSMPFTLLASFSGYMYYLVRKARAAVKTPAADSSPAQPQLEATPA